MTRKTYIYSLSDDSGMRYIGSTVGSLKNRLSSHLTRCKYRKTPVNKWLESMNYVGNKPEISAILICSESNRAMYEAIVTKYYRDRVNLLNIKDGTSTDPQRLHLFTY